MDSSAQQVSPSLANSDSGSGSVTYQLRDLGSLLTPGSPNLHPVPGWQEQTPQGWMGGWDGRRCAPPLATFPLSLGRHSTDLGC